MRSRFLVLRESPVYLLARGRRQEAERNAARVVGPIELLPEPQPWEPEQEDEHGGALLEGNTASAVFAMATAQAALAS